MNISSKVMMSFAFSLSALPFVANAQATAEQTLYPRKMVVEKATGTWCKYCPRGIVAMEEMAEKYPDDFIGIDIHINDVMACKAYNNLDVGVKGFPDSHVNRADRNVYPTFWEFNELYAKHTKPINAKVETTIVKKDQTSYLLETSVTLGYTTSTAKYNIAYAILEDKLGPYYQQNAYSGGGSVVGGWEKKPYYVSTMYDNVARTILPNVMGTNNSIPSNMTRDVPQKKTLRVEPAQYVTNLENAKVVTLLLDGQTGEIINADLDRFAGVTTISAPLLQENSPATESIYDISGRKMSQTQKGLQIVNGKKVMY